MSAHHLGPYRALGHAFTVEVTERQLADWLRGLLAGLADHEADPQTAYRLESPDSGPSRLLRNGEVVYESPFNGGRLVDQLIWQCNGQVIGDTTDQVLLHAAAADRDGAGIVLAGEPDQGKSTLVAALAARGLAYLTDEIVALDPQSLRVTGYVKPVSIDRDGPLRGLASPAHRIPPGASLYLAPRSLPGGWRATTTPRLVVLPSYAVGEDTRLGPLGAAGAAIRLARCTFAFSASPRRNLDVLARLTEQVPCYALSHGSIDEACDLLTATLDDHIASGRTT